MPATIPTIISDKTKWFKAFKTNLLDLGLLLYILYIFKSVGVEISSKEVQGVYHHFEVLLWRL